MAKSGKTRKANRRVNQETEGSQEQIKMLEDELAKEQRLNAERLDGSSLTPSQNQRLVSRAVREGWNGRRWNTRMRPLDYLRMISDEDGEEGIEAPDIAMATILQDMRGEDPKARQAAVKNLITMEKQNQDDEKQAVDPQQQSVNITIATQISQIVEHDLIDPDFIELRRRRALRRDIESGDVREVGQSLQLEVSPTPGRNGSGSNADAQPRNEQNGYHH